MVVQESMLAPLPRFRQAAEQVRDLVVADVVTLGEARAPTFDEGIRAHLVTERFSAAGLDSCSIDATGSASAVIPGSSGKRTILLTTNLDSLVEHARDQTIELGTDHLIGPFVGDNALALGALTTLPALLEAAGLKLKANIILLAAARALGRGNQEGVRHFLAQRERPVDAGICLESVQLGRLNYSCMGVLRGLIRCRLPDDFDWARFGSTGTIVPMSDAITRISQISTPQRPVTSIILGTIHGGIAGHTIPRETVLGFEVRSESAEILAQLREQIDDITEDTAARSGTKFMLDIVTERAPAAIDIAHPVVRAAKAVLTALGIQPQFYATTSQLSSLMQAQVPGITIGLTTGTRRHELDEIDERIDLPPLVTGLAQILGILHALDEGDAP